MDGMSIFTRGKTPSPKRWIFHGQQEVGVPHKLCTSNLLNSIVRADYTLMNSHQVLLDGSTGEGGGQILRTALTLSLLTGKPFRIENIRANRSKPGLRPQHLAAVRASAMLGHAAVEGDSIGSQTLSFEPAAYDPVDMSFEIGTAGATALVLQTLHLAISMRASSAVHVRLWGGTFNDRAPSFPFLQETWRTYQQLLGLNLNLSMPCAGFYPKGGGLVEAWIEPGKPQSLRLLDRGPLIKIRGTAGCLNLSKNHVAESIRARALLHLEELGLAEISTIELSNWNGLGQGAALSLTAEFASSSDQKSTTATFVGLGERGKPSEKVAKEAIEELMAFLDQDGAVDCHSADQLLLPLELAEGTSTFTTSLATEHLRTNAQVIQAFLHRSIEIQTSDSNFASPSIVRIQKKA